MTDKKIITGWIIFGIIFILIFSLGWGCGASWEHTMKRTQVMERLIEIHIEESESQ